ncbi:hypothetical protein [Candidatus Ichthyocystis hellenicum]|uniref:hypothetical protein n=1 Tax=Candidatus Ichthyocystis hellenicum TaxID=1561003 RepID=UPI001112B3B3|nr:hypothetical protein [Candidatus Ichthyocystis hellenicum]
MNIGRYIFQVCSVALLCLGLSSSVVFAQDVVIPTCLAIYNDPVNGVDDVPVNHQVTVYYQSDIPGICKSMVEMEMDSDGSEVPLSIVSSREWKGVVGGRHVIWGEVVVRPKNGFVSGGMYKVLFNRKVVSDFKVGSGYGARGHFLSSQDLILNFRNFPNVSIVTPDLANNMFEDVITGLIESRRSSYSGGDYSRFFPDTGSPVAAAGAREVSSLADELAELFYSFDVYQTAASRGNGNSDLGLVWRGLMRYLKGQFPRLFSPDALYPVRLKKMVYSSVSPEGRPVKLSAVLIYPEGGVVRHPYVVNIHHPTMPSNSAQTDGNTVDVLLGVLLASRGDVVVMSDLLGHGITSAEIEPYFSGLPVNYEYLDAVRAAEQYFRESLGEDITKLPIALIGVSQGARDAMDFSRFVEDYGFSSRSSRLMALSGPYDVHSSIMGAACVVSGGKGCPGKYAGAYVGYDKGIHHLAYKIARAAVSYRGFPERAIKQFFDGVGRVVPLSARSFYVHGKYTILHNVAAMVSFPGSDEHFNGPNLDVRLYHPEGDRVVPVQNTVDVIGFMGYPGNVLSSLKRGDCREGSLFSWFVENVWVRYKRDGLASHVVCLPYFFNDVLVDLG